MDDTDASALVHAVLQHDDEAARALVQRLYPLVAKIVRAHRPPRTDEEDLCQMIFIKVFQKLSQFSGKERLAIDLLYFQGRSVEEIRKITGWSAALIKVRAFRARQKMKDYLARISAREGK